ncbi:MAG: bifunctional histidine phosphatase family protein/GNAT family N-acetyltransferase [Eubacteriales bacterium]
MTTIYLIRHAEAEGNLYRRAHGQYDSLITENGYRQIRALAKRFAEIEIDIVWSSDLFRTMTTARAILESHGKNLNTHQGLREVNMGAWEDKSWGQLQEESPEKLGLFSASSEHWQVDHGETFEKLTERVSKTITDLAKQHQGKTMAIFCHGLAIRQFMSHVKKHSPAEWGTHPHGDNTSVNKLLWDGKEFTVEYAGDNSHLSDEISTFARQTWWKKDSGGISQDRNLWFEPMTQGEKDYQAAILEIWGAEPPAINQGRTVYLAKHQKDLVGWVAISDEGEVILLHLKENYRGERLGLQLLGQAVSHGRSKGLDALTIHCPPGGNLGFFEKYGFNEKKDYFEKYIGYQPRSNIFGEE